MEKKEHRIPKEHLKLKKHKERFSKFTEGFTGIIIKVERNKGVSAIKKGLVILIPAFLIASIALMLLNIPIPAVTEWIKGDGAGNPGVLNGFIKNLLLFIHNAIFGMLSLLLLITISYCYAKEVKPDKPNLHIISTATAVFTFIASYDINSIIDAKYFGQRGTVYALITAICATRLFLFLYDAISTRSRQYTTGADFNFNNALRCFFPMLITVAVFAGANLLVGLIPGIANVNELILYIFNLPFNYIGTNYGSNMLYLFFLSVLWFFGVHGGNALDPVANGFGSTGMFSKSTLDVFVSMGGGGAVICLVIALIIFSKSRANKKLAFTAAPSVIFNISEVMLFGLPVVFNAVFIIPFILTPLIFMTTTYIAMVSGLVPATLNEVTWTTPVLINGYIATGSLWGSVLQLFNLVLGTAVYYPFVRLSEKIQQRKKEHIIKEMTALLIEDDKNGVSTPFMERRDDIGSAAKLIATEIRDAVLNDKMEMFYQPQIDINGGLAGAEALLRWKLEGKYMYPPLLIKIAMEDNFYNELSVYIMKKVCRDTKKILDAVADKSILISANMSSGELNRGFVGQVLTFLDEYEIPYKNFGLEVVETEALVDSGESMDIINLLKKKKIVLSIDDFSMGSTSIKYLQNNKFDYVKLDGELVKGLKNNPRSADIISSITALGKTLGFEVIAEYVEDNELLERLKELGCAYFQGWLYSPAISADDFIAYAADKAKTVS